MIIIKERLLLGRTILMVPEGAKLLSIQLQRSTLCAWFEVEQEVRKIDRTFVVIGTGTVAPLERMTYHATVQIGEYVWHVYET